MSRSVVKSICIEKIWTRVNYIFNWSENKTNGHRACGHGFIFLGLFFFAFLSGCANPKFKPEEVVAARYVQKGDSVLYANIVKTGSGWRLQKLDRSGDVELGSFRYLGNTEPTADFCSRGFIGLTEGSCGDRGIVFYRTTPRGEGIILAPLTISVGSLFCPFSKFCGNTVMPVTFDIDFDWQAYMDAVQEAKSVDGYDNRFVNAYDKYVGLLNAFSESSEYPRDPAEKYRQLSDQLYQTNVVELDRLSRDQLKIDLIDKSGLAGDQHVKKILKNQLESEVVLSPRPNFEALVLEKYIPMSELGKSLLPADDLQDFEQKLQSGQYRLNQINHDNDLIRERNYIQAGQAEASHKSLLEKYRNTLSQRNGRIRFYDGGKIANALSNYKYELDMPGSLDIQKGRLPSGEALKLLVLSKSYEDLLPRQYINSNADMSVVLSGPFLVVTNNTKKYITVDAVSLYHQGQVLTRGGENFQNFSELAPGTSTSINLNSFNLSSLDSDYYDMTQAKAGNKKVNFGFAVKYRITETDSPRTLYKENSYSLLNLLKES